MRKAIVLVTIAMLAAYAAAPRDAAKEPHITMLHVKVVKDSVITADMLSPKLTVPQMPAERAMASLEGR
jgi:hypothetical protein